MKIFLLFIISLILNFFIISFLIKFQRKRNLGQIVREEGPKEHYKKTGTPTLGGISFLITLLITYLLMPKNSLFNNLLIFVLLQSSVGLIDDLMKIFKKDAYGLKARYKIILQSIFSLPFLIFILKTYDSKIFIPIVNKDITISIPLFIFIFLFLTVGAINSFNFTDGLDGLLAGLSILLTIFFMFLSKGDPKLFPLISLLGSLISFLWYNFHPAKIFMGDVGSTFLGAFFIFYSLIYRLEMIIPVLLFIFGLEAISVILQVLYFKYTRKRYGEGKRIFKMAPIHHHFESLGIREEKIVFSFWILQIIFVLISLLLINVK